MGPPQHTDGWVSAALRLACEQGFALAGVCRAAPADHADYFREWLAQGRHGEMRYLAVRLEQRLDPHKFLPGARSILCVADRYPAHPAGAVSALQPPASRLPPALGRIARYAWGADYHRVIRKRLFRIADALRLRWPGEQFRVAVDTAPIMERQQAARAGLGWIGKNTLLLHSRLGSYLVLGEVVTTLPIPDPAARGPLRTESHCGSCTRCIDACPTHCLTPYRLDARRCISYLTLEHRGPIAPQLHARMGQWFAGCDVCQEVCPFNGPVRLDRLVHEAPALAFRAEYAPRPPAPTVDLLAVLSWGAAARSASLRGSTLTRIKLEMARRNALIAAGNAIAAGHDPGPLLARVRDIAVNPLESEMLRETARQVLSSLENVSGRA